MRTCTVVRGVPLDSSCLPCSNLLADIQKGATLRRTLVHHAEEGPKAVCDVVARRIISNHDLCRSPRRRSRGLLLPSMPRSTHAAALLRMTTMRRSPATRTSGTSRRSLSQCVIVLYDLMNWSCIDSRIACNAWPFSRQHHHVVCPAALRTPLRNYARGHIASSSRPPCL